MWYISDAAVDELLDACWTVWEDIASITNVGLPWKLLFGGVAGYGLYKAGQMTIIFGSLVFKSRGKYSKKLGNEENVVYICSFPRDPDSGVPTLTPYGVKLETWLRMNNIQYEFVPAQKPSKKGLSPYIMLNGEQYADSSLIIDILTKHYSLDPTEGLSNEQQGISRAFQKMLDENTYWTYVLHRWVYKCGAMAAVCSFFDGFASGMILKFVAKGISKRAWMHGIGRHTEREVAEIGNRDIKAVSQVLGKNQFLLGDKPTLVDCCIFGHLSQIKYVNIVYAQSAILEKECTNIYPYLDRIKSLYWKDWDTICYE